MSGTVSEVLRQHRIDAPTDVGRYYVICPECSHTRSRAHQKLKCLGVSIESDGAHWGCNHCGWTGGSKLNGINGKRNGHARGEPFVAIYDYHDELGNHLFQVCRKENKEFPQRRPDGKGGWTWGTAGVRKVPYRLPDLIEDVANEHLIAICEGEKDVDNLRQIGVPATCNSGGASKPGQKPKWLQAYSEFLRGAHIVILPDNDEPGRAHAEAVGRACTNVARRIRVLDLAKHWPDCPTGGDISDWLAAGHNREELDQLIDQAPEFVAAAEQPSDLAVRPTAFSDDAIAMTFAQRHESMLRYVAVWSRWMVWDGNTWKPDDTRLAFDLAREMCREASGQCDPNKSNLATQIASAKTRAAVLSMASDDRRFAATTEQWDFDIDVLNTKE